MSVLTEAKTTYVVRNADSRVVVAFWGADAPEEAGYWQSEGYAVEALEGASF